MDEDRKQWFIALFVISAFLLLLPVLVPIVCAQVLQRWVRGRLLIRKFQRVWGEKGRVGVFVYSNSPNWKEYIELNVLPRISDRMVVLNWSERAHWKDGHDVEVRVFEWWAGTREFNPIAIVVPKEGKVQTLRFWGPFRDFKHGKGESLRRMEQRLFEAVETA